MPRILAFYLPQFHRVPENDAWWGEGFTEWTAVRRAESLFPGHRKPVVPLEGYYDLMERRTMERQAELAKKYGIAGFSFYHYYFRDGRKILERPAENLLSWQDIDMPFCFTWANETWARTWSQLINKNSWAANRENASERSGTGILLDQKYGREEAWRAHIEYLLPFFRDERYIKVAGRPVFAIYKPLDIFCLPDMIALWNDVLAANGIPPIYLIGGVGAPSEAELLAHDGVFDALYQRNPSMLWSSSRSEQQNGVRTVAATDYYHAFAQSGSETGIPCYYTMVNGYDDTPRRGHDGQVLEKLSPREFRHELARALRMAAGARHEFLFYNAWNEWGEGMYLEPDEAEGYHYLEEVAAVTSSSELRAPDGATAETAMIATDSPAALARVSADYQLLQRRYRRDHAGVAALSRWMELRTSGVQLADYLLDLGYHHIAIYGYGYMGRLLHSELVASAITVDYIIDRTLEEQAAEVPVYRLGAALPAVEVIVVTANAQYAEIRRSIRAYVDYPTLPLEQIIFECVTE